MEISIGEKRVRTDFNVSSMESVDLIKKKTAELINLCERIPVARLSAVDTGEQIRLARLAQTAYEEAAMWAVKAATFKAPVKVKPDPQPS